MLNYDLQRAVNESVNAAPDFSNGSAIVNEATVNGAAQEKQQAQQMQMLQQLLTNPNLTANLETSAMGQAMQANAPQQQPMAMGMNEDYSRNSDSVYDSVYGDLLGKGYSQDAAHYAASRKANEYRANRLAMMQLQMENGGYDPSTGAITDLGLRTLVEMQNESPEAAALYSNAFDMPKAIYGYNRGLAKDEINDRRKFELGQEKANLDYQRKLDLLSIENAYKSAMQQNKQAEAMQLASMYYQAMGASPEQAQIAALGHVLGIKPQQKDDSKAEKENFNRLDKWLERYEKANKDPLSGEWKDGYGPGDPEYDERVLQYNNFTAQKYDPDNYNHAISVTQSLIDKGYPTKGIIEYVDENFGDLAPYIKQHLDLK